MRRHTLKVLLLSVTNGLDRQEAWFCPGAAGLVFL